MPSDRPQPPAWRSLTEFGPHGDSHWVALRAAVTFGVPLLLLWSVDRVDLALPATFGAFTALYGRANAHRSRAAMQSSAAVVLVAAVASGTALAEHAAGPWAVALALTAAAAVAMLVSVAWSWHPPGVLFPVFAVGATASAGADAGDVLLHVAVAAVVALFALAVGALGALTPARQRPRSAWEAPRLAVLRSPATVTEAARTALVVGVAGAAATGAGLGHAYWAAVGAAAVASGPSTGHRVQRGLHRAVGTVAGVAVSGVLLALGMSPLATILVVIVLQASAELLIGRNYAVALVVITPCALLMVSLGSDAPASTLLVDRVVETVLGVVAGLTVVLAWDRLLTPRRRGSR